MNVMSSGFSEGFKYVNLNGLFDGISLVLEDWILLGSPVIFSVGDSFESCEGFKYGKIGGTRNENPTVV